MRSRSEFGGGGIVFCFGQDVATKDIGAPLREDGVLEGGGGREIYLTRV